MIQTNDALQIYRKAAFNLVKDLGDEVLPEPAAEESTSTTDAEHKTVENLEPTPATAPATDATTDAERKEVTTIEREPLKVPDSVHMRITPENLKDYVGPPIYQKDRMYVHTPPPGVSTGLGYLGNGSGSVLPVEVMVTLFQLHLPLTVFTVPTQSMPGKGGLQLTGKLGEVIRESCQIALSWVKSHSHALGISKTDQDQLLTDLDIHVHMPEGAIGKEGPSAGTAILSAFVSLFTKTQINPDIGTSTTPNTRLSGTLTIFFCVPSYDRRNFTHRSGAPRWWLERENPSGASGGHQDHPRPCSEPS